MVVLRRNLKKVSHKRSPGGTPLDKTIQETGIGLTPMITRALRKKFQVCYGTVFVAYFLIIIV